MDKIKACLTSKTNEHYTPLTFLIRVYDFFGGYLELDPCSNSLETPNTLANCHYTIDLDGLKLPWFGKVFVNPPYGRNLNAWVFKCIEEYEQGNATEILLLVPSRTDTKWTAALNNYLRCYISQRLKFVDVNGKEQDAAPFPSALFYLGNRDSDFEQYFNSIGSIASISKPKTSKFDKKAYMREYMRNKRKKL